MKVTDCTILNRAMEVSLVDNTPLFVVSEIKHQYELNKLKNELNFINFTNDYNNAMLVEYIPHVSLNSTFENWSDVNERVKEAKSFSLENIKLNESSKQLIKTAIDRLNLNNTQKDLIVNTAVSIAKLDKQKTIRVEHVAEAIQYQALDINEFKEGILEQIKFLQNELKKLNDK